MLRFRWLRAGLLILVIALPASGGEADVLAVQVSGRDDGRFDFVVTVRHADAGWSHYADAWEILDGDGRVLATRTLYHPHDHEQPFTRSLTGVQIADGVRRVSVRAHDSRHGYGGRVVTVALP